MSTLSLNIKIDYAIHFEMVHEGYFVSLHPFPPLDELWGTHLSSLHTALKFLNLRPNERFRFTSSQGQLEGFKTGLEK